MKFFRLDLLTLLISLFIFSGCNRQTGIGLDPDQKLTGSLYEYNDITVNTMKEDPVVTSDSAGLTYTRSPLAYINDPVLGTTHSSIALGLNLPGSTAYLLPTGTVTVDSAVLVLRYAQGFYGDSLTTRYKANVYQLASNPDVSKVYHATDTWATLPTLLGTKTFNARPNTPVSITDIVTGAKDTAKLVAPQIRIPISTAFINNNLFRATAAQLASPAEFQKAIKGLYVTLDSTQVGSNSTGGALMLALTDSSSVDVYYRTNDGNGTIDTAIVQMPFSKFAAEIKRNRPAAVTAVINNQATPNSTFYLQGMGGLKAKISFPSLKNITQTTGNIVINRADLVIAPVPGTTVPLAPQPQITMYQLDIAKQRTFLQDDNTADSRYLGKYTFGGFYSTDGSYHFIITGYIQDLLQGKSVDYGTYLGVADETNTSTDPVASDILASTTASVGGRLVAVGSQASSSSNYPYRIKLNIIYTKVNTGK